MFKQSLTCFLFLISILQQITSMYTPVPNPRKMRQSNAKSIANQNYMQRNSSNYKELGHLKGKALANKATSMVSKGELNSPIDDETMLRKLRKDNYWFTNHGE